MGNKILIIISFISLNVIFSGCCKKVYKIDSANLTYNGGSKYYLDIQKIEKINKGRKTFILSGDKPVYIKHSDELMLKKGWELTGESGNQGMIKEKSGITSAIKIKDADNIKINKFHLKMDDYVPAGDSAKSLIEIDNEKKLDEKIEIVNMTLSNHYSGVWIKRGRNIVLDSCLIYNNGHQIYLGYLPKDSTQIYKYSVNEVTIKNS